MTPQKLKNSILQLAIQGRLVEQRPEEGTAEELYRQIQRENIGTDSSNPDISEDEIPFDIPDTWKWVRVCNISVLYNGRAYKQAELLSSGKYPVLRVGNLFTNNQWYYSDLELEDEKYCQKGDLIYAWSASFGPHIWKGERVIYHYHIWKIVHSLFVFQKYLYYFLLADTESIKQSGHGLAMIHVTKTGTEQRLVPLPPLAEQKRIVAKIEELLPYIDRYEKAWSRLEDLNKRFPTDMQKSILQLAIQGKLVPQRPEEGTGEALYQQIQAEKQSLIRSGKLKKEKPLPEITDEEIPFEIPESWMWARIGDLFNVGTGMTPLKSESRFYANGTIPWVNSALTRQRYIDNVDTRITEYALANTSLTVYPPHTIIVAMYGQGKTRGQTSELLVPATVNQACAALGNYLENQDFINYVYYYYKYNYEILRKKAEGTSQPNLNLQKIKDMIIPLPPLAEQKRIVAKLEELLPLCERLSWNT